MPNTNKLVEIDHFREKLIELIYTMPNNEVFLGNKYGERYVIAEHIAKNLIANDVTIPTKCKDCQFSKYFETSGKRKCGSMSGLFRTVEDDEYCSAGERRDGE